MPIEPISSSPTQHLTPGDRGATAKPKNLQQATQQFEGMLIAQLLRMARSDDSGWLGSGENPASTTAMEFAEDSLAQSIAASGGLGLAKTQFAMMVRSGK